jgi:medium-chain acyl-[acyl-carrier-protein] hydrolase
MSGQRNLTVTSPWIRRLPGARPVRVRLLCLPHAGGGPSAFQQWRAHLPDDVELLLAHLPGREARLAETAPTDVASLVGELSDAIDARCPLVVYGHSWGAAIGLELTRSLGDVVDHLVVAGASAPHCPSPLPPISHLPREEFIARLAVLGGIPAPVLAHVGLMDAVLPALRADMRLAESFRPARVPRVACPITALMGLTDPLTCRASVAEWASYTTGGSEVHTFPGGHFFPASHSRTVVGHLAAILGRSGR